MQARNKLLLCLTLMLSCAQFAKGQTVSDDFNRTGPGLGSNWTSFVPSGSYVAPSIVSNQVSLSTSGKTAFAYYTGATWTDDQTSNIVVTGDVSSNSHYFALVRFRSTGGYACGFWPGTNAAVIQRRDSFGNVTVIGNFTVTVAVNDTLTCQVTGNTITASQNSTALKTVTDSTFGSGGNPGFGIYIASSVTATLDNWSEGTIGGGGGTPTGTPSKVFIASGLCNNTTAGPAVDLPTSGAATFSCHSGTYVQEGTVDLANGQVIQLPHYLLPDDWTSTVDAKIVYFSPSTSGTVNLSISTACSATDGSATNDTAWNTADSFPEVTLSGSANVERVVSKTGITMTGCSAGELLGLQISRGASDTAGAVRLQGIELTIRRAL